MEEPSLMKKGILKTPKKRSTSPSPKPPAVSFHKKRSTLRRSLSKLVPKTIRSRFTKKRTPAKEPTPPRTPTPLKEPKKTVGFTPSTKPPAPKPNNTSMYGITLSSDLFVDEETSTKESTLCKNGIKPVFKHIIEYVNPITGERYTVHNSNAYKKYIKYYNKASPKFDNYGCGPNMRLKYEEGHYCCVDPSEQATDVQILDHIYMLIDSLLENVSFLDITPEYSYHPKTMDSIENNARRLHKLAGHWMSLYKKVLEENPEFEDKEGFELHERATAKLQEIKEFLQKKRKPFQYSSEELELQREMEEERKPDGSDGSDGSNVYGYRKQSQQRKTFG